MKNNNTDVFDTPLYGTLIEDEGLPKNEMPQVSTPASHVKQLIDDLLLDEGRARMNLATFCQTYMEDEAIALMAQTLEKNAIDKSEYPQTAEIEQRCIRMLAKLWNTPKSCDSIGTSTVGSSEACMLAGMAMKFRWRDQARKKGVNVNTKKPNLIISAGLQVCWEKFATYFDIELIQIPMTLNCMSLDIQKAIAEIDDYTIGIVGIMGITYTGKFDDIQALDAAVDKYNIETGKEIVIHIDGASGAMFTPFVEPDLLWDFRLKNVVSISTSGHKYGLVYPGIGWVLWKDKKYLPKELVFEVSYLGGRLPTIAINFSRSASQIIAQYYTFVRYGKDGYHKIHEHSKKIAMYLSNEIEKTGYFKIYNDGANLPIVCYTLIKEVNWSLYDLADRLLMKGWQVPAYPLPEDLNDIIIQRFVCRADLGKDLAMQLIADIHDGIAFLNKARITQDTRKDSYGFTH